MLDLIEILKKEENPDNLKKILEDASQEYVSLKYAFSKDLNYASIARGILKRDRNALITFSSSYYTEREMERVMLVSDIFPEVSVALEHAILVGGDFLDRFLYQIREKFPLLGLFFNHAAEDAPSYPVAVGAALGSPFIPVLDKIGVHPFLSLSLLSMGCLYFAFRNLNRKRNSFEHLISYYKKSLLLQQKINFAFHSQYKNDKEMILF